MTTMMMGSGMAAAAKIGGEYKIASGRDPNSGSEYRGAVQVTPEVEGSYRLLWKLPTSSYQGIGLLVGKHLAASWGSGMFGVAAYQVNGNQLEGQWITAGAIQKPGKEVLERQQGGAGIAGVYRIAVGQSPVTGKPYQGTVTISANGDAYVVEWVMGKERHVGVGLLKEGLFVASFGTRSGAVVYSVKDDNHLDGAWVVPGSQKIGVENLAR